MATTKISWCDAVWNPTTGCNKGCDYCYARRMAHRLQAMGQPHYVNGFEPTVHPDALGLPLHWRKPKRVFVDSMGDLFDPAIPFEFIDNVFAIMGTARQHTFIILTKQANRMYCYLSDRNRLNMIYAHWSGALGTPAEVESWPLPNVWLLASATDQASVNQQAKWLLQTPAAVRGLSLEPLLGPVDLNQRELICASWRKRPTIGSYLDWVVTGGQSGPGAQPCHPDWVRSLRDQCQACAVPFYFKQWGEYHHDPRYPNENNRLYMDREGTRYPSTDDVAYRRGRLAFDRVGRKVAGDLLDGKQHHEFPGA